MHKANKSITRMLMIIAIGLQALMPAANAARSKSAITTIFLRSTVKSEGRYIKILPSSNPLEGSRFQFEICEEKKPCSLIVGNKDSNKGLLINSTRMQDLLNSKNQFAVEQGLLLGAIAILGYVAGYLAGDLSHLCGATGAGLAVALAAVVGQREHAAITRITGGVGSQSCLLEISTLVEQSNHQGELTITRDINLSEVVKTIKFLLDNV